MSELYVSTNLGGSTFPTVADGDWTLAAMAVAFGALNGGGGAFDGTATKAISSAYQPGGGSARGFRCQMDFDFKVDAAPSGGFITIMRATRSGSPVFIVTMPSGGTKLQAAVGAATAVNGATSLGTTRHRIEIEFRAEANSGWLRVWLDGTLEIDTRPSSITADLSKIDNLYLGVSASGKCTWAAHWYPVTGAGLWNIRFARDPT